MQQSIALYLFQRQSVHLPGLGSLQVVQQPAQADFVRKVIQAPQATILFKADTIEDNEDFVRYLANRLQIDPQAAAVQWAQWCTQAKTQLQQQGQLYLAYIGTLFQKGQQLSFTPANLPAVFLPAVPAERVVHPESDHSMLVGDRETTTAQMTEYLTGPPTPPQRWWWAALVLAVVAMGLCAWHFAQHDWQMVDLSGGQRLTPLEMPRLYQTIP